MLVLDLLVWLTLFLTKAEELIDKNVDSTKVSAPFPLGPKIKTSQPKAAKQDPEIYVTDNNCGQPRPFYVPEEAIGIYTETVTETTFMTHTTSKIINLGTTTTLTKSSTVTSTTRQTTTVLNVSTAFATTTVALSQSVFGGTVTTTKVIDTTIISTLYITPIAATSESFVTRFTRSTVTVSVTGTTVTRTLETVTETSFATFPVLSVDIIFSSTTTLSVFTNQPIEATTTITLSAYTSISTPSEFTRISETVTELIFASSFNSQLIFATDGPKVTLTGGAIQTIIDGTFIFYIESTIEVSSLYTFTDYSYITSLIT